MSLTKTSWRAPLLIALMIVMSAASGIAQVADVAQVKVRLERANPHESVRTFLLALQPENNMVTLATETIDFRDVRTAKERRQLARQLKMIMDGRGLIVIMDDIPRDADYVDSATGGNVYYLFPEKEPRIFLVKKGNLWKFSRETVGYTEEMFEELYPYGLDEIVDLMPHDWPQIFEIDSWKLLGLLILVVVSLLIGWALSAIGLWLFGLFFRRWGSEETKAIIYKAIRPLAFGIAFYIAEGTLPLLQLPVTLSRPLLFGFSGVVIVACIALVYRLSNLVWFRLHQRADRTENAMDDALVPLVERSGKFLIVLGGLVVLLQSWEINITAVLAGVSIGGVALAFAAQDTIKHLFGSAMIFIDRPFHVGDWIVVGDKEGTVEAIGFRSTRIRSFYNSLLYVPNGKLADMNIDNMGMRRYRRYKTFLGLQYDTPADKVQAFVDGVRKIIADHPHTVKEKGRTHVYFNAYSASSLDILVWCFFDVPEWSDELVAREELNLSFLRLADELGVSYAFPTRTVHIEGADQLFGGAPGQNRE